jgi:site-specific DNA-cytosine methylase
MTGTAPAVLELFCGLGGCAAAVEGRARIVAAIDQSRHALAAYAANFPHPVRAQAIEGITDAEWRRSAADLWWLSPPCTPYTRRGVRRDLDDPRARSLLAVMDRLAALRPRYVALENVPGFPGSRAHARLHATLAGAGYQVRETVLCPTELGARSRRPRFYMIAGHGPLAAWPERADSGPAQPLADLLDPHPSNDFWCGPELASRYTGALDVVDPRAANARTACFTSAYGRSPVRSGSYLLTSTGLRRFTPAEILRLLDFPFSYRLPADMPREIGWRLAGNSVSVRAVRWVLSAIPGLEDLTLSIG